MVKDLKKIISKILIVAVICFQIAPIAYSAVPQIFIYEGRLFDSLGSPLTTSHTFRFSLWTSSDFVAGDIDGLGAINIGAGTYSNWQEEHTITPYLNGTFTIELGSNTPLPEIDFDEHKFFQIEVKETGDPDTEYQLMDPTGDNGTDTNDRKTIGSLPYATNADFAMRSNQETFILDADDTINNAGTGNVRLNFGNALGRYLEYDLDNGYFHFNDSVNIQGDLTLTGLINGVDINAVGNPAGTTADTFEVNTDGNGVTINTAGLTSDINLTFDDADTIVVGENNFQTLTNKTINGDNNTITNIDFSSLKPRNKTKLLIPEYDEVFITEDGTDNLATMRQGYDAVNNYPYYFLTSNEASLQDLDIFIAVPIPDDFVSWQATPIQITTRSLTTNTADNQLDISIKDTTNTLISLNGATDLTSSVADTWEQKNITFNGVPTFTPGEFIIIQLNLQARSNNRIYASEIRLNYIGR